MVKYMNFHNSSFGLKYLFIVNGKATVWHTPYLNFALDDEGHVTIFPFPHIFIFTCVC
jgi:hypothetical protein